MTRHRWMTATLMVLALGLAACSPNNTPADKPPDSTASSGADATATTDSTSTGAIPNTDVARTPLGLRWANGQLSWDHDGRSDYRIVVDEIPATTIAGPSCGTDTCELGLAPTPLDQEITVVSDPESTRDRVTVPGRPPPPVRPPRNETHVIRLVDDVPEIEVIPTDTRAEAIELAAELGADPDVVAAFPDTPIVFYAPEGPASDDAAGGGGSGYSSALGLAEVHAIARGDGQTIAVIDGGVAPLNIFGDRLRPGVDVIRRGANAIDQPSDHGTQVAGVAASDDPTNPGTAPDAGILPFRVVDAEGSEDLGAAYVLAALLHPSMAEADVVVMSFGIPRAPENILPLPHIENALADLADGGTVLIAATGNHATEECNTGSSFENGQVVLPAASPDVVAVGGVAYPCSVAPPATGPSLLAPAQGIPVTDRQGARNVGTGTSFAAPVVAGLVADIRSCQWEPLESAVAVLERTSRSNGAGVDPVSALRDPDARCMFHLVDSTVGPEDVVQLALVGDLVHRGDGRLSGTGGLRLPDGLDCGAAFADGVAPVDLEVTIDDETVTMDVGSAEIDRARLGDDAGCLAAATLLAELPTRYLVNGPDEGPVEESLTGVHRARMELRSGACPDPSGWCGNVERPTLTPTTLTPTTLTPTTLTPTTLTPTTPTPTTLTPTTLTPTTPTPTTVSTSPAVRGLLGRDRLGAVVFGTASADALADFERRFGIPVGEEASREICQVTGRRVDYEGGLSVFLVEIAYDPSSGEELDAPIEQFEGWSLDGDLDAATDDGIGVGTTVADLLEAVPAAEVRPARELDLFDTGELYPFPPDFELVEDENFNAIDGVLTSAEPSGQVTQIEAGMTAFCFE